MVEMSFDLCHLFQKQLYWRTPSLYENGSRRWKRWVGKMARIRKQSLDWFLVFIHCHNKMWSVSSALLYILYVSISDPSQRWKRLENGKLKNKASLWQSTAIFTFEDFNETLIRIKDNAANKSWEKTLKITSLVSFGSKAKKTLMAIEFLKIQNHKTRCWLLFLRIS